MDSKILGVLYLLMTNSLLIAQSPALTVGEAFSFESKLLGEKRTIWVSLPDDYDQSKKSYPGLYLLDAEWNFSYVSGLVRQMISSGDIPPLILVGIVNTNRSRDLTPAGPNGQSNARFGGAKPFLDFLSDELDPMLADKYRLQPYRAMAGHSFGGLFTVFSMMRKPDFLQGYIALSPSLGRNDEQQVALAKAFVQKQGLPQQRLFVAVGNEGGYTQLSTEKFIKVLQDAKLKSLHSKYSHLPEENHVSITIPGFHQGLRYLFDGYNIEHFPALDDFFLVEEHYKQLSNRLGYSIPMPEEQYQKHIQRLLAERDLGYAFFLLDKYKAAFPNSTSLLRFYGDAHLLKGELKEARSYYEKLLKAVPDQVDIQELLDALE